MKRKYETVVILDGSLPDETVASEQEKIEAFLKENADFERTNVWGKRTLCYEIKKKNIGYYLLFIYDGESDVPEKFQKAFRLNQKILRHMTVLYEKKADLSRDAIKKGADGEEEDK